ncbi:major facilitator superfamily domain-containing protein [Poronia punctata]|nr:major facilitator superfamily domain-containing protein [Poronia punctata]
MALHVLRPREMRFSIDTRIQTPPPSEEENNDDNSNNKPTPEIRWRDLPHKDQLFILSLCRLSEPLSNVCLLPYIFYLVRSITPYSSSSSSSSVVSSNSGILVAAFPLAQFLTSYPWGHLSDIYGLRRPSILSGLFVSVIANICFGLSKTFPSLLVWRVIAGLANGNVSIMRTVTAEIVRGKNEKKFQTKAFLLLPLVFNSGMVLSLALGGCLAEPTVNLPGLFGPEGIFNVDGNKEGVGWASRFPYALPALLNAAALGSVWILAFLGLRETGPGRSGKDEDWGLRLGRRCTCIWWRRRKDTRGYTALENNDGKKEEEEEEEEEEETACEKLSEKPPRTIWTRKVLSALISFSLLPLHNSAFMHIFPVFLSSPPTPSTSPSTNSPSSSSFLFFSGGLGLPPSTIGLCLSFFGVGGILLQLFIYPRLQRRIGTRGVLRIALSMFPVTYLVAPYLSLLAGDGESVSVSVWVWVLLGVVVCAQIMARTMAIPSTVILLTEAAPSKKVLGTVHGAGNMLSSLARAVGPAVGGYVFAVGVEKGVVGLVWWVYLVGVALGALAWSYFGDDGV